jgi:PAS domain S-box-containing protein
MALSIGGCEVPGPFLRVGVGHGRTSLAGRIVARKEGLHWKSCNHVQQRIGMADLSIYSLESLHKDAGLVLCRGRRKDGPGQVLVSMPEEESPAREVLKRLETEYRLRAELDSGWAIRPVELLREKGQIALVLEDPGGEPLDQVLERPLELTRFLRLAIGLSAALGALHERGIIHKDIKPANVMVDPKSGQVWLMGFGFASRLARERQAPEVPEAIAGTLTYMAPEQTGRMNRSIDSRSDLYSLGVMLYEMLTDRLPFTASDPLGWVHCHIARRPTPPEERRKEIPSALSAIILKLLAKAPEDRYQTAAGLEADLRRCVGEWESAEPIVPFALGAQDVPDRLVIPEKLYGRDRERKALLEAFSQVLSGETPAVVLISGYSGVGKSSVVNELYQSIVLQRGIFISGKFDQYKRDIPYATLTQAFEGLVRQILSKNETELAQWRDNIQAAVGQNGQLMVNLIPELELIIGRQPRVPEVPPQEAQNRFQEVLRGFLGVIAQKEHPLVLFVDDLQWLDLATLKLLESVIVHSEVRYLLFIGAYRDNEVGPSHPLALMLESIRKTKMSLSEIVMAPLSLDDVSSLLADSLHQERPRTESLARLVHEKTEGNPFFAIQFISALAEEHLLEFDRHIVSWRWDIDHILSRRITDNIAELLVGKLNRAPETAREILKQLSCFGNRIEIAVLAMVQGLSDEELHSALREALQEGFVVHLGNSLRFAHDRIQEAAYSLIPEEMRGEAHLRLGRRLMSVMSAEELEEDIFAVVTQVNRGVTFISDRNEKLRVAELNVRAGRRAKTQTAYEAAWDYLSVGASLLDLEDWEGHYTFAFELCLLRAECAFLCGRFDQAKEIISCLLERASSKADKAAAYRLNTDLHIMKSAYREAVDSSLECLRLFGICISAHPSVEEVDHEYKEVWRNLGERSIESLIDLPLMTDPEIQDAMRVLSVLYSPAFFVDTKLFYLSICHIVNLTLKYGVADASAHGYAYFGFILGPAFSRYTEGYRFGQLSVNLIEKHGFVTYKAKVYMTMAWVAIWTQPITTALEFIRTAFSSAVEMGDLTYACYACDHTITDRLVRGDHLDEVWHESEQCLAFVRKAKSPDYVDRVTTQRQFIQTMRGQTKSLSTFSNALFDERNFEAKLADDRAITCWYWVLKLQARFISDDYDMAMAAALNAERLLWAATGCIQLSEYHYYSALTIAALYTTAAPGQQNTWREKLAVHLEQLGEWARHCSITFLDKYALVSAEIARIESRDFDAIRFYEQAIQYARKGAFIHNEAIASEVAAKFYLDHGLEVAGYAHLRNARCCYLEWGARGKVQQLDQIYRRLEVVAPPDPNSTSAPPLVDLDQMAVIKALQAVSREIDLDKLMETVMVIAVEWAGAERGLLFLGRGLKPAIVAEASTRDDKVQVTLEQGLVKPPEFPESILRYVIRARESVILADASTKNSFSDDKYLRSVSARSILCLPLVKQGIQIGELYLENNQLAGVFTWDRLAVLELLTTQAAISLENARLYSELWEENGQRIKAEEALRASEERMNLAAEAANLGMWAWELANDDVWATTQCRTLFGFEPNEPVDFRRFVDRVHAEDRKPILEALRRSLESRSEYDVQFRLAMPDGRTRWISTRGHPTFDAENKPVRVMGVSMDITAAKLSELQLLQQRDELAHLSRLTTIGQLATTLAHELNQPIGAIHTNAEAAEILLKNGSPDLDEIRGIIGDVRRDSWRAGEVIHRMRALLRKHEFRPEPVDIKGLIEGVSELLHGTLISRKARLRIDLAPALPLVSGDPVHLQQVLLNLILNALEAMIDCPPSERQVVVRARANSALAVEVAVIDQGPGFIQWKLSKLFEPFLSTKKNGMGMGLPICHSIIRAHGGHITGGNNPDRGATVQFTLRIWEPSKEDSK